MKTLTPDQLESLLASFPDTWHGRRNRLAVILMHSLCLRISEATGIHAADLRGNSLDVSRLKRRGKVVTHFQLPDWLARELAAWVAQLPAGCVWLLPTSRGGRLDRVPLARAIVNAAAHAGFEMHPHMLRHTGVTNLIQLRDDKGQPVFDLHEVQYLAGHSSVATTSRYLHVNSERMKGKMKWL